ncbi:protein FAM92A-B-like isoform X2 [Gigantopelta aegis]|uniref:protein FAM92A-B-like isoform X2 n=1 Tax=Gigantopelta aegis TaxID=1735272 RepID=UPI001B889B1F|nr:protein FAM92A-B-like isoform X2 [Gigantopelta aegis]
MSRIESEVKFSQRRIKHVEKYFGLICDVLGSITRKNARLRDKGDMLCKHLMSYVEAETINSSSSASIRSFAEHYSAVQDYRNAEAFRLDAKVVAPLTKYDAICKEMKKQIKENMSTLAKEDKAKQKLAKATAKGDRMLISRAQSEFEHANRHAADHHDKLESAMEKFEQQKLSDIKKILKEFVTVEMLFHSRALEYLGKCFEDITSIDEQADLDKFNNTMSTIAGTHEYPGLQPVVSPLSPGPADPFITSSQPAVEPTVFRDCAPHVRIESETESEDEYHQPSMYGEDDDDDDEGDDEDSENRNVPPGLHS